MLLLLSTRQESDKVPLGRHRLVSSFMHGVRRLRPARPISVPFWDLSVVLERLLELPFEPLESAPDQILALSVSGPCMEFPPGLVKMFLQPRPGLSTSFCSQVVMLHSFSLPPFASAEEDRIHFLCPVQALKAYVDRSGQWCKSSQLFVCFEAGCRGFVSSKHKISHWVRDAISWLMRCGSFLHLWALVLTLLGVLNLPRLFLVLFEDICVAAG